jgi:hypothetical protein
MLGDLGRRRDRIARKKIQTRVQRPFHAGFVALDEFDLSAHGLSLHLHLNRQVRAAQFAQPAGNAVF